MHYPNTLAWLKEAANYLDSKGQIKYADALDHAMRIIVANVLSRGASAAEILQECREHATVLTAFLEKINLNEMSSVEKLRFCLGDLRNMMDYIKPPVKSSVRYPFTVTADSSSAYDHIEIVDADNVANIAAGLEEFGIFIYKVQADGIKKNYHIIADTDIDISDIHDILCEEMRVDKDSDLTLEKVEGSHEGCHTCMKDKE